MKNRAGSIFALSICGLLASGCSSDIVVKSDVGETSTVKKSSVSSYKFDAEKAAKDYKERIKDWKEEIVNCVIKDNFLGREDCESVWGTRLKEYEKYLALLPSMPEISIVQYRTVYTDVNGDKKASSYKHVACLPEGTVDDKESWLELIKDKEESEYKLTKKSSEIIFMMEWLHPA
mgnify:CR=1 FL=1